MHYKFLVRWKKIKRNTHTRKKERRTVTTASEKSRIRHQMRKKKHQKHRESGEKKAPTKRARCKKFINFC